ncbi:Peroxisomal acyl-coenzyme A oxidase 3-like protein [Dinothrombium tinctorium]|uniref:Acyl-coenzyme A oxidase n=1 Tax=Dinothrombium tinctorium TaxID=1965070 RepID=A0A3S3PA59_9ACAR|nr:Peroxisomal acyl-coenzyme A oxidase 3-like protein [Dinothrombium tinctorium]RWS04435.1 Peroxisomal acyl-coenzyme A oxidase 3-like protein [Dinothrombium tinctorium]RWS06077.1 Peroxisomal acyl-coenzyme A oxidase 3-like protein [Dinothrombium tinctorium]
MMNESESSVSLEDCLPDWPAGPLDEYRKRASFDWRKMRLLIEGESVIKYKAKIWKTLENDPLFARNAWEELSRHEEQRMVFARLKKLLETNFCEEGEYMVNPFLIPASIQAIGAYNWSLAVKRVLSNEYFATAALNVPSERNQNILNDIKAFKAFGCICITEMAHGSNTKDLQTTATFDPKTQEFILNTPNLEATKVWSGVLGHTATHAYVFAQLYTPDNQCHGLHTFLVNIRDPKTLQPYQGVIIGDMGPKIGLNGLDNGFMNFKNYRIAKECLIQRSGEVTEDGKYIPKVKSSEKSEATLGMLSTGRVFITNMSITNLQMAVTIAVRYSAIRRQFGPTNGEELQILEYQTQQWRLMPYVAAAYVLNYSFTSIFQDYIDFVVLSSMMGSARKRAEMGAEIHALSSCAKAMCGWIARDAIQESREACGGHGYLKASRLGEIRNDHDANNTYEGDNNVLLQQTSNYLMKFYKEKVENKKVKSPFGSVNYIENLDQILASQLDEHIDNMKTAINSYHFIVCWLLKQSDLKMSSLLRKHNDDLFKARNECQAYFLRTLAIAYFECNAIERFHEFCKQASSNELRTVLERMGTLFALWSLEKHLPTLYESNYIGAHSPRNVASTMREAILTLCLQLKNEAVSLVDAIAPPDFILNSCLGNSDGRVYEHIFDALSHNKGAFERPSWYTEFTENKPNIQTHAIELKAKL